MVGKTEGSADQNGGQGGAKFMMGRFCSGVEEVLLKLGEFLIRGLYWGIDFLNVITVCSVLSSPERCALYAGCAAVRSVEHTAQHTESSSQYYVTYYIDHIL